MGRVGLVDEVPALKRQFSDLSELLAGHRLLWSARPFVHRELPWEVDHPDVAAWLRSLPFEALQALDDDPIHALQDVPATFMGWAEAANQASAVPRVAAQAVARLSSPRLARRVPARKWAQVQAFVQSSLPFLPEDHERAVDWCAGKGHLGRALQLSTERPVTLLEYRPDLCEQGANLMRFFKIAGCEFHAADVLTHGRPHLGPHTTAFGLHACGDLWRTLLEHSCDEGAAAVVAPCCYHRLGGATDYAALSSAGRGANLALSQHDLRLTMAEVRTARPAIAALRLREQAWRLGLDLLLREASGEDRYLPQGTLPSPRLDFRAYCEAAAVILQRDLPSSWNPESAQAAGEARALEVYALGQVRSLFRRPMEVWLVLDAAMAQMERGRQVRLGTFCDRTLTPRNLILASLPA